MLMALLKGTSFKVEALLICFFDADINNYVEQNLVELQFYHFVGIV